MAVTDAEGIDTLRGIVLPSLLALIAGKVVGRAKPVAAVVDADDVEPEERVSRLAGSLESRGYRVAERTPACSNVWKLVVQRGGEEITLLVAVSGVFESPFNGLRVHELEDHLAYRKLIEGRLTREEVLRAGRAKELVAVGDLAPLDSAGERNMERAFGHMVCLLRILAGRQRDRSG